MRFLFSFPLPLLLIFISPVVFDTKAAPSKLQEEPSPSRDYAEQSTTDNQYADLSRANEHHARRIGPNHFSLEEDGVKPMALGSEVDSSKSETLENYEQLPFNELEEKKEQAEKDHSELEKTVNKTRDDLKMKEDEAKAPLDDFAKKKQVYEELKKISDGMNKELRKAEAEFKIAKKELTARTEIFDELKEVEEELEEAKTGQIYVENAQTRKPIAENELSAFQIDCPKVKGKRKAKLVSEVSDKNETRNTAQIDVNDKEEDVKQCRPNCGGAESVLTTSKTTLATAISEYEQAVKLLALFNDCPEKLRVLPDEIRKLDGLLLDHAASVEKAKDLVKELEEKTKLPKYDNAEENQKKANEIFEEKKTAKEAAEKVREFSPDDVRKAEEATRKAKSACESAEPDFMKFTGEIGSLKTALRELEEKFARDEERFGALMQVYQKKSKDRKPDKGSGLEIGLGIAGFLLLAIPLVLFVVYWFKFRKPKEDEMKQSGAKDSAATVASQAAPKPKSDSSSQQKPPEPNTQPAPALTPSNNNDQPTPPNACGGVISVDQLPEKTEQEKNIKNAIKSNMKENQHVRWYKAGFVYRVEDKPDHYVSGHWRHFVTMDNSFCQHPKFFAKGAINLITNTVTRSAEVAKSAVSYAKVTYVATMNCLYNVDEYWRKNAQKRKEDVAQTNANLSEQKSFNEQRKTEKKRSGGGRDEGDKNQERSDVEENSTQDSKKETGVHAAKKDKKRKTRKPSSKRERKAKRQEKESEKDTEKGSSEPTESESDRSYNYTKMRHHSKRRKTNGSDRSEQAKSEKKPKFANPTIESIVKNMEKAKAKEQSPKELLKILKDIIAAVKSGKRYYMKKEAELYIIKEAAKLFKKDKKMVERSGAVNIVADLHGNADNLLHVFTLFGGIDSAQFEQEQFIFLGDYIDRGSRSDECMQALLILKILRPDKYTLLRGNHETYAISMAYGFRDDLIERLGKKEGSRFHEYYSWMFAVMPLCCKSNEMLFMHGGIPRPLDLPTGKLEDINNEHVVPEFIWDVRDNEIACQLTWGDPKYGISGFQDSQRGVGYEFGADAVKTFCDKHELRGVVRGHQKVQNGSEFFADDLCLTLFTCTTYDPDGKQVANHGAVMTIDANKAAYLHIFVPKIDFAAARLRQLQNLFKTCMHIEKEKQVVHAHAVIDESETGGRTEPKCEPALPKENRAAAAKEARVKRD